MVPNPNTSFSETITRIYLSIYVIPPMTLINPLQFQRCEAPQGAAWVLRRYYQGTTRVLLRVQGMFSSCVSYVVLPRVHPAPQAGHGTQWPDKWVPHSARH